VPRGLRAVGSWSAGPVAVAFRGPRPGRNPRVRAGPAGPAERRPRGCRVARHHDPDAPPPAPAPGPPHRPRRPTECR
jgi:hypothetical protein